MRSFACVLGLCLLAVVVGCEARISLGGRCASVADCVGGLLCLGGRCREECRSRDDCAAGLRCVAGPGGARVCSLAPEERCNATDPCDETLFAECRAGRCVTGCANGAECVSGSCDTSSAVGVCVEPVSSGDADAGATEDAHLVPDAGDGCLPEADDSLRSVSAALLGVEGTVVRGEPAWLEMLGAPALTLDPASAPFALGVRLEGPMGPEVLAAVRRAGGELTLRRGRPLDANPHLTVADDGALASGTGFGALGVLSSAGRIDLAVLRTAPANRDDPFGWVYRQDDAPRPLTPMRTPPGLYPGDTALLVGPGDEVLFAVRFSPEEDAGGRLGVVASALGPGNATDIPLPLPWGRGQVAVASAPGLLLLHEPITRESRLVRITAVMTRPVLDDDALALDTSAPPAIAATPSLDVHRVLAVDEDCGRIPMHTLRCDPTGAGDCDLEPATVALVAPSPTRVQASALGRSVALLVDDRTGARLIVVDEDGDIVDLAAPMRLGVTEPSPDGGRTLRLVRTGLAATATPTDAIVAIAGLYVDDDGSLGRIRVIALRATAP